MIDKGVMETMKLIIVMITVLVAMSCTIFFAFNLIGQLQPTIEELAPNSTTSQSMQNINSAYSLVTVIPILVAAVIVLTPLLAFIYGRGPDDSIDESTEDTSEESTIDDIEQEPEAPQEGDWACPYCGAINPEYKYLCQRCGAYKTKQSTKA